MRNRISGFQPLRLYEARNARGLTQTVLAEMVERTPASVSKWEKGIQLPDPEVIERLSDALKIPASYFLKPPPTYGAKPLFFRSMAASTKKGRDKITHRLHWLQNISHDLQEWVELPEVNLPQIASRDFHALREVDIEEAAIQCRQQWGLGNQPIQDVLLVLENAGIVVAFDDFETDTIDGVSHWFESDNRPYILLARDKQTAVRSRFDAAHELGHLILHRGIDPKTLSTPAEFKLIEQQAHRFASAFLLPSENLCKELCSVSLECFKILKKKWKISIAAIIKRCHDLEIITKDEYIRLWKYMSREGWRTQEPFDDFFPIEEPRLIQRSIRLLIEEGGYTSSLLLEELQLPATAIEKLSNLPSGYLTKPKADVVAIVPPKLKASNYDWKNSNAKVVQFPNKK